MTSNVIELPRPAAAVRDTVSAPVLELIELPELGFGEDAEGPAVQVESELAETIEMVDVPAIEPPAAPVLKLVEDFPAPGAEVALAPVAAPEAPPQSGPREPAVHEAVPAPEEAESDD